MPLELSQISKVIYDNADKSFVERIIFPKKFPVLDNGDGSFSTHSMGSAEVDGMHIAFPTVLMNGEGNLQRFDANEAIGHALRTKNFIEFDNEADANDFSINYKQFWNKP